MLLWLKVNVISRLDINGAHLRDDAEQSSSRASNVARCNQRKCKGPLPVFVPMLLLLLLVSTQTKTISCLWSLRREHGMNLIDGHLIFSRQRWTSCGGKRHGQGRERDRGKCSPRPRLSSVSWTCSDSWHSSEQDRSPKRPFFKAKKSN